MRLSRLASQAGTGQFKDGGPAFVIEDGTLIDNEVRFTLREAGSPDADGGTGTVWVLAATLTDDGARLVDDRVVLDGDSSCPRAGLTVTFSASRDGVQTSRHVVQSKHPYGRNESWTKSVEFPGARAILVVFDKKCDTERGSDTVTVEAGKNSCVFSGKTKSGGRSVALRGHDMGPNFEFRNFVESAHFHGSKIKITFRSDGDTQGWDFSCLCTPLN